MTPEEYNELTEYQKQCHDKAQKLGNEFVKAITDFRDSIPFADYNGDAYSLGMWIAGAFNERDREKVWESLEEGFNAYFARKKDV